MNKLAAQAFIIGIALGDGNLSNPNKRAVRLRITCDNKYPNIIKEVVKNLTFLFPDNKVAIVNRSDNCVDVSLYSNKLKQLLPWKPGAGTKYDQQAHIPTWIFETVNTTQACLRGLILSDGSIYRDRGYLMVNVCTNIEPLATDILALAELLGFRGTLGTAKQPSGRTKYTVRFARNSSDLLFNLALSDKK